MVMSAIESVRIAIRRGNGKELGDALARLIAEAPGEWERLLLSRATPDANISSFATVFKTLLESARYLLEQSLPPEQILVLVRHLAKVGYFHRQFQKTDEVFYGTAAWNERDSVKIWRTCAALESQNRILGKLVLEQATKGGVFDPAAANADFLRNDVTGDSTDAVTQSETGTEVAEIIIRTTLQTSKPTSAPRPEELKSPYEDADFATMHAMGARYVFLCEAWRDVKYNDWSSKPTFATDEHGEQREVMGLVPPDRDAFLRLHVSYRRENIFQTQEFLPALAAEQQSFTDTSGRIQQLAQSLKHPETAQLWDGAHNARVFRNAAEYTSHARIAEQYVDFFHYGAWIGELRAERRSKGMSEWDDYLKVRNALRVLGQAFQRAADRLQDVDGNGSLRQVIRVKAQTLARVVSEACRLDLKASESIVSELTFDPGRRDAEWWDMPLVPLGAGDILFVPIVAVTGNPIRSAEHMVAAFTNQDNVRSRSFEKFATEHLEKLAGCSVQRTVKFTASDSKPAEFDVVALWKDHLLLVELKCLRSVKSAYEEFRASQEIHKAISQLERRRKLMQTDWDQFRRAAPKLCLPDDPIGQDKVICIAVSNLMTFTGLVAHNVYVTDHFCFRRFFSKDPRIMGTDYSLGNPEWVRYGRIRRLDDPSPEELTDYLRDPPQIRWIKEQLELQWQWLYPALEIMPMCILSTHFRGERIK
jgi:hypothetical protein